MSEITLTTWTCDRCGEKVSESPSRQPARWVSVYVVTPPKAVIEATSIVDKKHLCYECRKGLVDFLNPPQAKGDTDESAK